VAIFADTDHDDAGWVGEKPYFDITVDCNLCHNTDLPLAHGNDCATCHPSPNDTLGVYGGGCQQGGCHASYHDDVIPAHYPFEDAWNNSGNDCNVCHEPVSWDVPQLSCLNCHSAYSAGDVSPPVTTSSAIAEYVGPARIDFSLTDNGKVGVGRTFYQLDGGPVTAAGKNLFVVTPGQHDLEFWSKDQSDNLEPAHNNVYFNITSDSTPPATTSDVQASYYQGAVISLTATDASTLGVKQTYYSINGGAAMAGTNVVIPPTNGTFNYTLTFWSEDWSGNTEAQNTANFSVTSGTSTLRLVWGDSDLNGSPCPGDPEAWGSWTIRKGGWTGPVVATGSGTCPNWDGVDDITVPVGVSPYFVRVDWWDSEEGYSEQSDFANISVANPGEVVRLSY